MASQSYGSSSSQRTQQAPQRRSGGNASAGFLLGSIILGICLLVAGFNIGGNIKKMNKTVTDKVFADTNTYNAPSDLTSIEKKYLTETEAAAYLNLSKDKVLQLISSGEIAEYVKTDTGYSISVKVLDEWFENEAYQTKLGSPQNSEGVETGGDAADGATQE